MRRAASAIVGALLLGVGAFALVVAGVLIVVVGSDGVASAPQARAVTPATAIVLPVSGIDAELPDAVPTGRATIEAVSLDERPLFIGAGPADDVLAYLNGTPYEVAEGADARASSIDLSPVGGEGTASPPTAQSLWTVQTAGTGVQRIELPTSGPEQLAVIMRVDGASPVDVRMATSVEIDGVFAATIALAAGGAAAATLGLWLLLGPMARPRRTDRTGTDPTNTPGPAPTSAAVGAWGAPIASSESSAPLAATPPQTASRPTAPWRSVATDVNVTPVPSPRAPLDLRAPMAVTVSGTDVPDAPPREA